jgi:hypothetical protein
MKRFEILYILIYFAIRRSKRLLEIVVKFQRALQKKASKRCYFYRLPS